MTGRARTALAIILTGVPVILLLISATSWLRTAIDLPVADDWRAYIGRSVLSRDPQYFVAAENDTLYPVGKLLDAFFHITLGGNTIVLQLLTMVGVLGGLLAMQWILLRLAFRDTLHTAIVFSLCSLMLMTRTYWGGPNVAYHQVVPVVVVMAVLVMTLRPSGAARWAPLGAFALGLAAGFIYVSGAWAALTAGATMVMIGLIARIESRDRVLRVGAGLAIAGLDRGHGPASGDPRSSG